MLDIRTGAVPGLDLEIAPKIMDTLHRAIKMGLVNACHDLSEGGLALALAEMAFSGDIGVEVDIQNVPYSGMRMRYDSMLFSESNTRFLVELTEEKADEFTALFRDLPLARIGRTIREKNLKVFAGDRKLVDLPLFLLRKKWLRKVV